MTSAIEPIWLVVFQPDRGSQPTERRVAAIDLKRVLAYFNEDGLRKIIKIEKFKEEITYRY